MRMPLALCLTLPALCAQAQQDQVLAGKVLGPERRPVAGALVAAVPEAGGWEHASRVFTDAEGRFKIPVKPGGYALTATKPGLRDAFLGKLNVENGKGLVDLALQMSTGGFSVSGLLVDPKGLPVKNGEVAFIRYSQDEGDVFFAHMDGNQFKITLGPGSYSLVTQAPGLISAAEAIDLKADVALKPIAMGPGPSEAGPEVKAWIKANAIPIATPEAGHGYKDLRPLKEMVGKARVVSLGEATHGTRDFFQMKHRMLEFLVEKMGFTVFGIEASMPEARAVDEYVLEGKGDPAKALAGLYFWTWDTQEVLDMIRWMRRYNEDPKHSNKVRFYGFDMQFTPVAFTSVKAFLDKVDPEESAWMEAQLPELRSMEGLSESVDAQRKSAVASATIALLDHLDSRQDSYAKSGGAEAFAWARQEARILVQYAEMTADANGGYQVRDRSMAENILWILGQEKGAKAVLWAHNSHIAFDQHEATGGFASMGQCLRKDLGNDMVVLGFSFLEGGFQAMDGSPEKRGLIAFEVKPNPKATLTQALASAGLPTLALDLRKLPASGPVHEWFAHPQGHLDFGALFSAQREDSYLTQDKMQDHFDGIFFMEKTSAARANPTGKRSGRGGVKAPMAPLPMNLGFEDGNAGQVPSGWILPPMLAKDGFKAEWVNDHAHEGRGSLWFHHSTGSSSTGWGNIMQSVDAKPYRGKTVRLSGWIRTDGKLESKASLWMRVDREKGRGFFDNAQDRALSAKGWTPLKVEGKVDMDATTLNFGCLLWGAGSAWFDDLKLEMVD